MLCCADKCLTISSLLKKKKILSCSVCRSLWCKDPHHCQLEPPRVMPVKAELGRAACRASLPFPGLCFFIRKGSCCFSHSEHLSALLNYLPNAFLFRVIILTRKRIVSVQKLLHNFQPCEVWIRREHPTYRMLSVPYGLL